MAASQLADAKTGGSTGPTAAAARFPLARSGTPHPRQGVARRVCLTTIRQDCGTSAVNGDVSGGSLSQGRVRVSQYRIPLQTVGREVLL